MDPKHDQTGFRAAMALAGLSAGLALWALSEFVLNSLGNPRLELWLFATAVAYCVPALLLSGPMTMPRAMLWALGPGVIAPALLLWASLRFSTLSEMTDAPQPFVAFFILVVLSLPYLVALQRAAPQDYVILFNEAWRIVIRAVSAGLFVGVFWGVYMMSNLLLSLVGVDILDTLLDQPAFAFGMTGLVIGLALSVLYEQRAYLSPVLLMRLLQLLLVPVTVVVFVFVLRVPLQGLNEAFSGLSAAATLMAMILVLATLISAALDCEFGDPPPSQFLLITISVACILMPVLAFLAAYAIWERVADYGWTPDRVSAAMVCLVTAAYAISYAVGVLWPGAWDSRLRRSNVWIGVGVIALAAVSLTPALDAQRISAKDQLTRYQAGQLQLENLPLFEMANRWGRAGTNSITELQANATPELARVIDGLQDGLAGAADGIESLADKRAALALLLPLRPDDADLPGGFIDQLPERYVDDWLAACRHGVGRCVAVVSDQISDYPGAEIRVFLWTAFGDLQAYLVLREPRGDLAIRPLVASATTDPASVLNQLLAGDYAIEPPRVPALRVGNQQFIALPR
ncbi:MAG: DUF4153 domain-containing protein [Dinoroseobacter sp.]|nr:DUF4153 domain-containing protein [Dinoroseobacter sp.]